MGVFYETIPDSLKTWILEQQMLWVYVPICSFSKSHTLLLQYIARVLTSIFHVSIYVIDFK
jgi:hypothetical protein